MPRLPLHGSLDLTYRCNNNCRHCWLRLPPHVQERDRELSFDELRDVVDQARAMGCREWSISGGEPMLRPDFPEIFDYVTSRTARYSINTNGTLITPEIARLMCRPGTKMVAIYGGTAEVHDHVTRHPGSFAATMRGFAYLQEAGAGFIVQLVPMRDNFHQWDDMIELAESLSPHWRVGASWLYLSASGDPVRNKEIARQRLDPRDVIELDRPDPSYAEWRRGEQAEAEEHNYRHVAEDDHLFAPCLAGRRKFHIDPYGGMSFCSFLKDPALRYNLRQGSFQEAWDDFIPSLADHVRGGAEYSERCGSCDLRADCRWCPVYGYLEHRRFSAPVDYLCAVAREARLFKEDWHQNHRRYYQCAGITIQVDSDLPIIETTFHSKFKLFEVDGPGEDTISIQHHFSLPDLAGQDMGKQVYRQPPWAIYEKGDSWIYLGISALDTPELPPLEIAGSSRRSHHIAVFNRDHSRASIYSDGEGTFRAGDLRALTMLPTDQILISRLLADRQGCCLHSSGVIMDGQGLVFAGHSEAGKSTMVQMLEGRAEILCDDRNIVRRWPEGFRVHGTWSHGDVPIVSGNSAPLRAILFLEKAPVESPQNCLIPLEDRRAILRRLLACLVRPLVTADWWQKSLDLVGHIAREVPCYVLRFDRSGRVLEVLRDFVDEG